MLEDALFSFDSPKSIKFSFGFGSVSINANYMAKMKFLFNEASIYPSQATKETVMAALSLVREKLASKTSINNINNAALQYFAATFLSPDGEYYSKDNLVYLESSLTELAEDIDLWLDQIAAKEAKKRMAIAEEINLMAIETDDIQQAAKEFLSQKRMEPTLEETRYFINAGKSLRHCYDDWLYQIIQDDSIADVFYLHIRDAATIKGKFIIQCIEHGDSKRASELVDRMVATSAYPDYAQKWGYPWENSSLYTMKNVLEYYFPDAESKQNNHPAEHIAVAVSLSERIMQHLSKHTKKEMLGYLALTAPYRKYVIEYVDTLIDDVEHYAQVRRPRGWGNQVYRISSEIIESFSILEALGKESVIVRILRMLQSAGPALEPINYDRWIEMCEDRVSERTFKLIKNDLAYLNRIK